MKITFNYNKSENAIYTKCPEVITNDSMRDYFNELISKKGEIKNAHEIVDFTGVKSFNPTYSEFKEIKHLYEQLVKTGSIKNTTFKVCNAQQQAMAKLYLVSVLASSANNEVDYDFQVHPTEED